MMKSAKLCSFGIAIIINIASFDTSALARTFANENHKLRCYVFSASFFFFSRLCDKYVCQKLLRDAIVNKVIPKYLNEMHRSRSKCTDFTAFYDVSVHSSDSIIVAGLSSLKLCAKSMNQFYHLYIPQTSKNYLSISHSIDWK